MPGKKAGSRPHAHVQSSARSTCGQAQSWKAAGLAWAGPGGRHWRPVGTGRAAGPGPRQAARLACRPAVRCPAGARLVAAADGVIPFPLPASELWRLAQRPAEQLRLPHLQTLAAARLWVTARPRRPATGAGVAEGPLCSMLSVMDGRAGWGRPACVKQGARVVSCSAMAGCAPCPSAGGSVRLLSLDSSASAGRCPARLAALRPGRPGCQSQLQSQREARQWRWDARLGARPSPCCPQRARSWPGCGSGPPLLAQRACTGRTAARSQTGHPAPSTEGPTAAAARLVDGHCGQQGLDEQACSAAQVSASQSRGCVAERAAALPQAAITVAPTRVA